VKAILSIVSSIFAIFIGLLSYLIERPEIAAVIGSYFLGVLETALILVLLLIVPLVYFMLNGNEKFGESA
jgi:uncharacterized membrane protein